MKNMEFGVLCFPLGFNLVRFTLGMSVFKRIRVSWEKHGENSGSGLTRGRNQGAPPRPIQVRAVYKDWPDTLV